MKKLNEKAIDDIMQRAERRMPPSINAFKSIVGREAVPVNGRINHIAVHSAIGRKRKRQSEQSQKHKKIRFWRYTL